jgi:hypothetical protein
MQYFGVTGAALRCNILEEPEQHLGAIFWRNRSRIEVHYFGGTGAALRCNILEEPELH